MIVFLTTPPLKGDEMPHTNKLINESSPYLLQHAHNPVDWYPWGEEAFRKAAEKDKPVIISIGYSSCHWCHVMEEESFEDEEVARLMNEKFISIKVDREERPDIDACYMNAVQQITRRGGWPLNAFALPDGRPFYGGTYFPREDWLHILNTLADLYANDREKLVSTAEDVERGIEETALRLLDSRPREISPEDLAGAVREMIRDFDTRLGGVGRAPKFPMPSLYRFLLAYSSLRDEPGIRDFVLLTLDRMASGGIYDQIGGGYARYSTDASWKIPHFEKMLYDNAQLVSLYSDAWRYTRKENYRRVVCQTLEFVEETFTSPEGAFYSALDADSEGEEGAYYVWEEAELKKLLGGDYDFAREYFGIGREGLWEEGKNILLRPDDGESSESAADGETIERIRRALKAARDRRIPPGLDDKALTSWNALMITAYADAWRAFGEPRFLDAAVRGTDHILEEMRRPDGGLYRAWKEGRAYIEAFLEDYAHMTAALITLFEVTGDTRYLDEAEELTGYILRHFYSPGEKLFYSTPEGDDLITRIIDIQDNVLPSPNAVTARNLFRLYKLTGITRYRELYQDMTGRIRQITLNNAQYFSHWAELLLFELNPFYEVVTAGPNARELSRQLQTEYLPHAVFAFTAVPDETRGLFAGRYSDETTRIYICRDNACLAPVTAVDEALAQLLPSLKTQ